MTTAHTATIRVSQTVQTKQYSPTTIEVQLEVALDDSMSPEDRAVKINNEAVMAQALVYDQLSLAYQLDTSDVRYKLKLIADSFPGSTVQQQPQQQAPQQQGNRNGGGFGGYQGNQGGGGGWGNNGGGGNNRGPNPQKQAAIAEVQGLLNSGGPAAVLGSGWQTRNGPHGPYISRNGVNLGTRDLGDQAINALHGGGQPQYNEQPF